MPLEIYEIVKHSTTAKIVPMLLNIAVVAYLDRGRAAGESTLNNGAAT